MAREGVPMSAFVCALLAAVLVAGCGGVDSTPPSVVSTIPADGETMVQISDPVFVVFSERMSESTVTGPRFVLSSGDTTVATTVSYDDDSKTATIHHAGVLDYGTDYTVTVSNQVADMNGNRMRDEYSFSFTTAGRLDGNLSWINPLPQGNTLRGVWSLSPNDVFAVGAVGTIIRFDGTAWSVMESNTMAYLMAVWGNSPQDVYAVGEGGVIMHYDGASWSLSHLESNGSTLRAVWGSSASNVFVGAEDVVLRFDGTSWTETELPNEPRVTGIWGFSDSEVYASAMGQAVFRFDGSRWSVFEEQAFGCTLLWALWGSSPSDLYTGGYSICTPDEHLFRYDGTGWSVQENIVSELSGIWGSSRDDVYAVGPYGYKFRYDGSGWTQVEKRHSVDYRAISGTSAGDVFAVGDLGLIDHYDGTSWRFQNGTYAWSLLDVLGFGENDIYAAGDMGVVLRYDGASWEPWATLAQSRDNFGIAGTAPDNMFVVNCFFDGFNFDGGDIYRYDGVNWTALVEDPDVCFQSVWAASDGNVFAVGFEENGEGMILRSEDNGATWIEEQVPQLIRASQVTGASSDSVIAVGGNGSAFKYDSALKSWAPMRTGTNAMINSALVLSKTEAYAVDENGLFLSYDGNEDGDWELVAKVSKWPIRKIWGKSGDDLFMIVNVQGERNVGGNDLIFHYDGNTFSKLESIADKDLYSAWGASGESVYFVGDFGAILHYER